MLLHWLRDPNSSGPFPFIPVYWEEDGGAGGAGGESDPPDPNAPPQKTFTQEEVEQRIAGRVKKLKTENEKLNTELSDLKSSFEELKKSIQTPPQPPANPDPNPAPDDLKGQLALLERKSKEQLEKVTSELEREKQAREDEKKRRLASEKMSLIDHGLSKANVRPDALNVARKFFEDRVNYDEDENKFDYEMESGGTVSVEEGIVAELPAYLRNPELPGGGSGTTSGKGSTEKKRLETEKEKLAKLGEAANSGQTNAVLAYRKQKKLVADLEASLAAKT